MIVKVLGGFSVTILILSAILGFNYLNRDLARPAIGTAKTIANGNIEIAYWSITPNVPTDKKLRPAAIMIPSLGRPASDFNELAQSVSNAGYRVFMVEPRGLVNKTGLKHKDITLFDLAADIEAVRQAEQMNQVVVLGHAFGNRVARSYATAYDDNCLATITIAAGGLHEIEGKTRTALIRSFWTFLPDFMRKPYVRHAFFADGNSIPDYWMGGWYIDVSQTQIRATMQTNVETWWAAGSAPLLVIQGKQDTIAPPQETGNALQARYGDRVTLVTLDPAGHALLPEQPEEILSATLQFMENL
jgi:pimeloyl-ACP methyl ester carboxylesterase